ncbi:hypothetical protein FQN57_002515 [Myotisia sp. PD_48]|nr:hypothetical protein FQN57_002515 [Myotisia sp. PD_48]
MAGRARRSRSPGAGSLSPSPQPRPTRNTRSNRRGVTPSNPEIDNPALPSVETQQSFAYGSTNTPLLPRQLEVKAPTGAAEMANSIGSGLAQNLEQGFQAIEQDARASSERQMMTRAQRRAQSVLSDADPEPRIASPTRRAPRQTTRRRERTPEDQLQESLREASEEPASPPRRPSVVEGSSVSWITERHIIDSTQQPEYRSQSSRPVRGPVSNWPYSSRNRTISSQAPVTENLVRGGLSLSTGRAAVVDVPRLGVAPVLHPTASTAMAATPPVGGATPVGVSTPNTDNTPASSPEASPTTISVHTDFQSQRQRWSFNLRSTMTILFMLALSFGIFIAGDNWRSLSQGLRLPWLPCSNNAPSDRYTETINKLITGFDRRLNTIAEDASALREEWNRRLPYIKQAINPPTDPLQPRRVNFLAVGLGALVDPRLTSPVIQSQGNLLQRVRRIAGHRPGPSPVAALLPWDDVGDCWCAAKHKGMSQLAVVLGRPIVPEEVIVEHIPRDATLDVGAAPRHMEMWAEYSTTRPPTSGAGPGSWSASNQPDSTPLTEALAGASDSAYARPTPVRASLSTPPVASSPGGESWIHSASPTDASLRDTILSTLNLVYPDEPATAYSDDPALGPAFFRVGRWQYDINGSHHIQRFLLDAVIDMPGARVERVVFRVKSNWGAADHTCLYRLRLHGHL